jgi:DNA-binding transcriptional MerR regulator
LFVGWNEAVSPKTLRTTDLAKAIGVHVNTIRLYEADGFLSPVPRNAKNYRHYSCLHLEQARLAYLAIRWPYLGDKSLLTELVRCAARNELDMAMELAYRYLAHVRVERTHTEAAIRFMERWAAGHLFDSSRQSMQIREVAIHLDISVDTLRNWERNGLINVPRHPLSGYRQYGSVECGRLRVIRTLLRAGFSVMAILTMMKRFDEGVRHNLLKVLDLSLEDSANQAIEVIADHWLSSLLALEERAKAIIQQIELLGRYVKPYI